MLKALSDSVHYDVVRLVASGGMGHVYEAYQKGAGQFLKRIAIKIIREEYSKIKAFRDNFMGEAVLVSDLIHTNIVQIYHLGMEGSRYYMTMEYVEGINLEEFIELHRQAKRAIPVEIAAFIVSRICRGLAYAHQKCDLAGNSLHIVHRDVTPRNIMISVEGDVKLTDFGIAKARDLMYNKEGEVTAGRDEYLSPEQARLEVTDNRADLFSCGVVLAELCLGYNCFEGRSGAESRSNILSMPLPPFSQIRPEISKELDLILNKALARPRKERYANADELLEKLELFLYKDGYGPTNEKLAHYLKSFFEETA